jgi:hypothetical protein
MITKHYYIELEGKLGLLLVPVFDFIVGVGVGSGISNILTTGAYIGAGIGLANAALLKGNGEYISEEGGSGQVLVGLGTMPIVWVPVFGLFMADKWIFDLRYRIPLGNDIALIIPFLWLGSTPNDAINELKTIFIDIVNEGLRNPKRGIF